MQGNERDGLMLELDLYQRMWAILEDLETLLWRIKGFNEELEGPRDDG